MPDLFAAIPTADYAVGRAWWERFFGREPDLLPNDHEAAWRVTTDGWIYVNGRRGARGDGATSTLLVDDLDAWIERLALDVERHPDDARRDPYADDHGPRGQHDPAGRLMASYSVNPRRWRAPSN